MLTMGYKLINLGLGQGLGQELNSRVVTSLKPLD